MGENATTVLLATWHFIVNFSPSAPMAQLVEIIVQALLSVGCSCPVNSANVSIDLWKARRTRRVNICAKIKLWNTKSINRSALSPCQSLLPAPIFDNNPNPWPLYHLDSGKLNKIVQNVLCHSWQMLQDRSVLISPLLAPLHTSVLGIISLLQLSSY